MPKITKRRTFCETWSSLTRMVFKKLIEIDISRAHVGVGRGSHCQPFLALKSQKNKEVSISMVNVLHTPSCIYCIRIWIQHMEVKTERAFC